MQITTLSVGQLAANCYLLWDEKSLDCFIVDPGDSADYIQNRIRDLNLIPQKIIATHAHFDHIQAVLELQLAFSIPFLMHKDDVPLLNHYRSSCKYFTGTDPGPAPKVDEFLKTEIELNLNGQKLTTIHTPGHTPGGICLYSKKNKSLFSGDTIFADGAIGRTDFGYGNPLRLQKSINRIFKLPKNTIIYPGHGKPTTIKNEASFWTRSRI